MESRQDPFEGEMSLRDVKLLKQANEQSASTPSVPTDKKQPPQKQQKGQTMTGEPTDQIVINPSLSPTPRVPMREEVDNETHAIVVGGFSPFTKAHQALVAHARSKFKHVHVFATESKTRPIPAEDKVKYIKKAVGSDVHVSTTKTPLHAASEVFKHGAKKAVFVGGSDRVGIVDRINQYNGKEGGHGHYNFDEPVKLEVFGSERKEGSSGLAGISGTKARAAKSAEELKQYIPTELHGDAKTIHRQIHEHLELLERVVSFRQRLRRGITMQKYKNKIARARKIARKRLAGSRQLRRRSFKRAKTIVRTRIAGRRGAGYSKLSTAQKIAIDKMVANKGALIKKIATRIAPRIKRDEVRRLTAVSQHKKFRVTNLPIVSDYQFTDKVLRALNEKAEQSGIPLSVLKQVFNRGMAAAGSFKPSSTTAQQQAFARINSFIKKGKSYKEDDKDLAIEAVASLGSKIKDVEQTLQHKIRKELGDTGAGAGLEGTYKLAMKYAKETPGQKHHRLHQKLHRFRHRIDFDSYTPST